MREWLKRFQNTGTIIALAGAVALLLQQFGFKVDLEWVNATVSIICTILVILGVANNPTSPGMDLPITKPDTLEL